MPLLFFPFLLPRDTEATKQATIDDYSNEVTTPKFAELTRKLDGAIRFIIDELETTPPTRPVEVKHAFPPRPPVARLLSQVDSLTGTKLLNASRGERPDPRRFARRACGVPYRMISRGDRGIALAGFASEHCTIEELPSRWHNDRTFLLEALELNFRLLFRIPQPLASESHFLQHLSIRTDDMVWAAFEKDPDLRCDKNVWSQIIDRIPA